MRANRLSKEIENLGNVSWAQSFGFKANNKVERTSVHLCPARKESWVIIALGALGSPLPVPKGLKCQLLHFKWAAIKLK